MQNDQPEEKQGAQTQGQSQTTGADEETSPKPAQSQQPPPDDKDAKIEELTQALARAMADLQNFRRRSEEEKVSFIKYANVELLKNLLPLLDNLDRSILHLPEDLKEDQWAKGIVHLHADLTKTLKSLGVEKIKTVGEKLDPQKHEGLMSGPGEKDVIVEEFEPGYTMDDTVIKVARVKVGDGSQK